MRRLIASGQLAPGEPLPSVRELAMTHAVNPMTISKAYAMLEAEGALVRNRGKPMTVAARQKAQTSARERLRQIDLPGGCRAALADDRLDPAAAAPLRLTTLARRCVDALSRP